MAGFILAEKLGQTQMFDEAGKRIPVTSLKTSPCFLVDIKDPQVDGYFAVKLGFRQIKDLGTSVKGQLKKAGIETPLRFLKEVRLDSSTNITIVEEEGKKGVAMGDIKVFIGEEIKPSTIFKAGDIVKVTGISKGKGFQGVVKRHGFAGGPKTHGQSDRERAPGSMGQTTTPGHTYKGKRMAGRMGGEQISVRNLKVVSADDQGLQVSGLVPGHRKGILQIVSY
jgi:large subunit ribosomal protein L3